MVSVGSFSASLSNKVFVETSKHEGTIEKNKMRRRLLHGKKEQGDDDKHHDDDEEEDSKKNIFIHGEDFMQEIFLRLPIKSLHRLKYLSKISSSLISSPCFLPKYLTTRKISTCPLMLGFFYQLNPFLDRKNTSGNRPAIRFIPCSSEAKKLMMKEDDDHNQEAALAGVLPFDESLSFLLIKGEDDYPGYYDEGYGPMFISIVASSNGFLLCRKECGIFTEYCVCNPFTQQWILLPQPPSDRWWRCVVEGFICEGNNTYPCLDWVNYKVVRALKPGSGNKIFSSYFTVEIFSSETGEWLQLELNTGPSYQAVRLHWPIVSRSLISKNGTVCTAAICNEKSLVECAVTFNLNHLDVNQQLQVIPLPVHICDDAHNKLDESEGLIRFIRYENKFLEIYELNEDEMKWLLKYTISMREVLPDHSGCHFDFEALQPLNSALVLLNLRNQKKVLLDMKNKTVELISEFATSKRVHIVYPYYWPCWPPLIN
ncbi:hypothetical protein AQUCO_02000327v1 [Aquilegia coerulea]|uniref:F-box protein At3g26010-like beta-propeller domain-containing protein n=1 Tax=Aquilegia coerulea TaxID=218851 RepID=A0A2G5DH46_AQUCA|nr:hypothetical protein AQUCO_02000327v1 [Aquilegia coerulea]